MKRTFYTLALTLLLGIVLGGCSKRYVPKPYGYFRIDLPENSYQTFADQSFPYSFDYSRQAVILPHDKEGEEYWIDVFYPKLNARIHCSYKPVKNDLRQLSDDAQEFVYKHSQMASSIPEQGYEKPEDNVYGVYYELKGNTASPYQFYLTDSTRNFFRGAVYFNCQPNQDSLAPVIDYLEPDIKTLIESFKWQ